MTSATSGSQYSEATGDTVVCTSCGIDVPFDESVVPEVTDQLMYLRGFACYALWRMAAAFSYPVAIDLRAGFEDPSRIFDEASVESAEARCVTCGPLSD